MNACVYVHLYRIFFKVASCSYLHAAGYYGTKRGLLAQTCLMTIAALPPPESPWITLQQSQNPFGKDAGSRRLP